MITTRKEFLLSSAAFAVAPLFAGGRAVKTPLMLDTKDYISRLLPKHTVIWNGNCF